PLFCSTSAVEIITGVFSSLSNWNIPRVLPEVASFVIERRVTLIADESTGPVEKTTPHAIAVAMPPKTNMRRLIFTNHLCASHLTTQAQRRRPRDAPIATTTARRRSLQR